MSGPRRFTDAQLEQIAAWRERGWSKARIARQLTTDGMPVSASAIGWQCLRIGADLPVERRRTCGGERRGGRGQAFTAADDARLLALAMSGNTRSEIARQLGRNRSSVIGRLLTLARADERMVSP